jgi:hypothetical protein
LTIFKNDNALATFLADNPRKYKYRPYPISLEDVLFLLIIKRDRTSLAIGFP